MDWIGKVSYILGHLALEVFAELRNLSIPGIWDWKQTGIVCLGHLISHNRQRGSVLPSDFNGATPLVSCFECLSSEYMFLIFTWGGGLFFLLFSGGILLRPWTFNWKSFMPSYILNKLLSRVVCSRRPTGTSARGVPIYTKQRTWIQKNETASCLSPHARRIYS